MASEREDVIAHAAACRVALAKGKPRPRYAGANLSGASLRGADLRRADLSGASLRSIRCAVELPVSHPDGYRVLMVQQSNPRAQWRLYAGCRGPWTAAQALAHWGSDDYGGDPTTSAQYLYALAWWEECGAEVRHQRGER